MAKHMALQKTPCVKTLAPLDWIGLDLHSLRHELLMELDQSS
jgi:hypothetical protein